MEITTEQYLDWYYANNQFLKEKFRIPFPRFGVQHNERSIEYPWVLSQVAGLAGRRDKPFDILDIGYVRAERRWVGEVAKLKAVANIHMVDRRPVNEAVLPPAAFEGFTLYQDDILNFRSSQRFDVILLISALEHFGKKDHLIALSYGHPPLYTDPSGFEDHVKDIEAMKRIAPLLKPGGVILVTVPYGQLADYGSHIIYDQNRIELLLREAGLKEAGADFYYYAGNEGWQQVERQRLAGVLYQQNGAPAATGLGCFVLST